MKEMRAGLLTLAFADASTLEKSFLTMGLARRDCG